jgi:PEP-CTERM motif-containing protein
MPIFVDRKDGAMSTINHRSYGRAGADKGGAYFQLPLKSASAGCSRAALFAGASLIALAAFGRPGAAYACSGANQTVSTSVTGPIVSTNGAITVTSSGTVTGGTSTKPDGVDAFSCSISTLTNSGTISGGFFGVFNSSRHGVGVANSNTITTLTNFGKIAGAGGTGLLEDAASGILNSGTIKTLSNNGTISGGAGLSFSGASGGSGGVGVRTSGAVTTLTNNGTISGGDGGSVSAGSPFTATAGAGAQGIVNLGTIGSLTNSAGKTIKGGNGGAAANGERGGTGADGVANFNGTITTLTNKGTISGGNAGGAAAGAMGTGPNGGAGVSNEATVTTLTNSGAIGGGSGGNLTSGHGGAGGAGVSNSHTITSLTNSGMIGGGHGGSGVIGGAGGTGVWNNLPTATITQLNNQKGATMIGGGGGSGLVKGGAGGAGLLNAGTVGSTHIFGSGLNNQGMIFGGLGGSSAGAGGAGVANRGLIRTLSNSGTISGGEGGRGVTGGVGGAGVSNSGTIGTLTNSATISGGRGGTAGRSGAGGVGGAGVSNSGTTTNLTNSGTISGGSGGFGPAAAGGDAVFNALGATIGSFTNRKTGVINAGVGRGGGANGDAIDNEGAIGTWSNVGTINGAVIGPLIKADAIGASGFAIKSTGSIGPMTNSGEVIGNVLIDQTSVSITGGTGKTFGSWSAGTITIGGDLTFAGGNTDLADNIVVHDGRGTVTNGGVLRLATPEGIRGAFDQTPSGTLAFALAGDVFGKYGALTITGDATLGGGLALDPIDGFKLAAGDTFDLMTFGADAPGFSRVSLGGAGCSATLSSVWDCGSAGFNLDVVLGLGGVDVTVAAVPEPSTWIMLAAGFLGLAGLGLRGGRRALQP